MTFQDRVAELRESAFTTKINTTVVGMRGAGKSTLLKVSLNDFYSQQCKKRSFEGLIFVYFRLTRDLDFFTELIENVYDELQNKSCDEEFLGRCNKLYEKVDFADNTIDKFRNLKRLFKEIVRGSFDIIVCVDDFHYVQDSFSSSDYGRIRSLSEELGVVFILSSIYPIEMLETCSGDNSNLQQIFNNRISLTPFEKTELDQYLETKAAQKSEIKKFERQIANWSGGLPGIFVKCVTEIGFCHTEELILKMVDVQYDAIEQKFKEKLDLLHETIKTVIGPIYNTNGDKRTTLIYCYGYLRKVSEDYKRNLLKEIIDENSVDMYLGLRDEDGSYYVLFSDYYTIRFIEKYRFERDYFPIWSKTESLLRKMVRAHFKSMYGTDYENKIKDELHKEVWERAEHHRDQEKMRYGHNELDVLEYLDTNDLLNGLIEKKELWKYYNDNVFVQGNKKKWHSHFETLAAIRRPLCHNRDFPGIKAFYNDAVRICEEITRAIVESHVLDEDS